MYPEFVSLSSFNAFYLLHLPGKDQPIILALVFGDTLEKVSLPAIEPRTPRIIGNRPPLSYRT